MILTGTCPDCGNQMVQKRYELSGPKPYNGMGWDRDSNTVLKDLLFCTKCSIAVQLYPDTNIVLHSYGRNGFWR